MRRALAIGIGLWLTAGSVGAGPDERESVRVQQAFEVGDLTDRGLGAGPAAGPTARAIVWVRDAYWRPVPTGDPRALAESPDDDPLLAHVKWLVRVGAHPSLSTPSAGMTDPFPILSALVADRNRREREGLHSTRTEGPLAAFATDEYMAHFLNEWVPGAYGGPTAVSDREERPSGALKADASRNRWLAIAAVLGLIVMAVVGGLILGRRPARPPDAD